MTTRRGSEEELLQMRQADASVTQAETALEVALATSDDPKNDPEVRKAKMQLAGAEAARQEIAQPLEDADVNYRKLMRKAKKYCLCMAAGIALFSLGAAMDSAWLILPGAVVALVSLVVGFVVLSRHD